MNAPPSLPDAVDPLPIFISLSVSADGKKLADKRCKSVGSSAAAAAGGVISSLDDDETPDF